MTDEVDDWWYCPKCDGPTFVCHSPLLQTKRCCSECEWEYQFSEVDTEVKNYPKETSPENRFVDAGRGPLGELYEKLRTYRGSNE